MTPSPYRDLLSSCANSNPPDYVRYYLTLFPLLAAGAPTKLCRALGEAWAEPEHALLHPTARPVTERIIALVNRVKLTAGVTSLYGIPDITRRVELHHARALAALQERGNP